MKLETYLYNKVKEDASYIVDIATELKSIRMLEDNDLLSKDKQMNPVYEERKLRDIKNALSNIYLILELHEVVGMCDQIYNSEFKPLD